LFNGVIAVPATVTATKVTVVVPADASTGKLTVVTGTGSGQSTGTFKVLPKLTSFTPPSGPAGASVTVAGTGFAGVTTVKVNGVAASFSVLSKVQLRLTVPASAASGTITVATAGGTATSAGTLSVLPRVTGFTPSAAGVGTTVTINGNAF